MIAESEHLQYVLDTRPVKDDYKLDQGYVSKEKHANMILEYEMHQMHLEKENIELRDSLSKYESREMKEAIEELKAVKESINREKGPSAVEKAKEHTFQRGPIIYCQGDYLDD